MQTNNENNSTTPNKKWICIQCNAKVPDEIGITKTGICPECKKETRFFPSYTEKPKKTPAELIQQYNIWLHTYDKKTGDIVSSALNTARLAELIFHEFNLHFLTTSDSDEIWFYNGSYYEPNGESVIRYWVERLLDEETTEHYKREILGYIKDKNPKKRNIFNADVNLINLKNGVYNIKTGELQEHSPENYFINEIPVIYNKDADCPKIKKFFSEVIYEDDIVVLQEFFGYCLYRRYNIHRAVMLIGDGKNGKSTMLGLLTRFLGKENVSGKELQNIIENRFGIASLYGKLANIAGEIPNKVLKRTGIFKSLTGEDLVNADKKFKSDFDFINYAKLIFSTNTLPRSNDDTYAFFRRWILISFPNTFEGKKCDKDLLEKISTESEISGLFNWAVQGLQRLLKNSDFSYNKSVDEVMEQYKTLSDPVYAYVQDFLTCKTGEYILKEELRKHYTKWCKTKKLPVTPMNMLTLRLGEHLSEMRAGKTGCKGKQKPAYMNITWKDGVKDTKKGDGKTNLDTFSTGGIA